LAKADIADNEATAGKPATPLMQYVYLLQSHSHPQHYYVGLTADLRKRLAQHNNATSPHTKKFCPWELLAYFASGSGRAFVKRHFRPDYADPIKRRPA
jgi:putative endonuclease